MCTLDFLVFSAHDFKKFTSGKNEIKNTAKAGYRMVLTVASAKGRSCKNVTSDELFRVFGPDEYC